ncbi:type II toxin-antitoxin system prevent-host-death family antitoxin [Candidatus Poriferisocius sp.]|uniref:type II toxin-antitoxin system Phd/YefM family antitoxin n=1 Tax=Candidatus Poriferisocius sp. TaxID=3101276 RepID=UPI003B013A06
MSPETPYRTIPAGEFKAKCLKLMDEVNDTGEQIVITKHGRPVSRLVPAGFEPRGIHGRYKGMMPAIDDPSEGAFTEEEWDEIMGEWDSNQQWWLNPAPADEPRS